MLSTRDRLTAEICCMGLTGVEYLTPNVAVCASNRSRGLLIMDLNRSAFRIVQQLTTENKDVKRLAAARVGGKAGGPARAAKLTPEQRKEISVKANKARWKRKEVNHG